MAKHVNNNVLSKKTPMTTLRAEGCSVDMGGRLVGPDGRWVVGTDGKKVRVKYGEAKPGNR